ncbi:MAG: hypothetical protein AAGG38_06335 [Planctomycetota bacterium]
MTDFHNAIQGAVQTARSVAGTAVAYLRRGTDTPLAGITAILGTTRFEKHTSLGTVVMAPARDFLIAAAAMVEPAEIEGEPPVPFDPEPGDRIALVQGGTRFLFEVMPLEGSRESEWLDSTTDQYRIHTRLVKRQPAGDQWP